MIRFVRWAGLAVVLVAAAVLSFDALRALALAVSIPAHLAWLLPVAIDAGGAVSCAVWLSRDVPADAARFARTQTWLLLGGTVLGNAGQLGMHAAGIVPPWWVAVLVGAIPPAVVGGTVHLSVLVGRPEATQPTDETSTADESSFVWAVDSATGSRLVKLYPDGFEEPGDPFSPDPTAAEAPARPPFVWAVDEAAQLHDYAAFQRLAAQVAQDRATAGGSGDDDPPLPARRGNVDTSSVTAICDDLRAIAGETGRQYSQDEVKSMYGIGADKASKVRRMLGWWPRAVDQADQAEVTA